MAVNIGHGCQPISWPPTGKGDSFVTNILCILPYFWTSCLGISCHICQTTHIFFHLAVLCDSLRCRALWPFGYGITWNVIFYPKHPEVRLHTLSIRWAHNGAVPVKSCSRGYSTNCPPMPNPLLPFLTAFPFCFCRFGWFDGLSSRSYSRILKTTDSPFQSALLPPGLTTLWSARWGPAWTHKPQ